MGIYELKPKAAGAMSSTTSKHGDKLRFDFVVLPGGEIGILDIYDRRNMFSRGKEYKKININLIHR